MVYEVHSRFQLHVIHTLNKLAHRSWPVVLTLLNVEPSRPAQLEAEFVYLALWVNDLNTIGKAYTVTSIEICILRLPSKFWKGFNLTLSLMRKQLERWNYVPSSHWTSFFFPVRNCHPGDNFRLSIFTNPSGPLSVMQPNNCHISSHTMRWEAAAQIWSCHAGSYCGHEMFWYTKEQSLMTWLSIRKRLWT